MTHIDHITNLDSAATGVDEPASDGLAAPIGRRKFIAGVGTAAGAAALATALPAGIAHAALPSGATKFVPLSTPVRAADTREPGKYNFSWVRGDTIRVPLVGLYGIPVGAAAVVGSITAVNRGVGTAVTVFPSGGAVPKVSNLNVATNDMNANMVTVKIANGGIDIWTAYPADLIFDVVGYYVPVSGPVSDGRFMPLGDPVRAYDSRDAPRFGPVNSGESVTIDVTRWVPADASAVAINLTTANTTGPTYLTVYPANRTKVPNASNLNVSQAGAMRASAAICRVSNINNSRQIKVYVRQTANVIVDVVGYYTGKTSPVSTNGLFVPARPYRLVDTRDQGPNGRQWSNWKLEVEVPADASTNGSAIAMNVTMVQNYGPNLLKVTGARQAVPQNFSNVNAFATGMIVPNHVISRITAIPDRGGKSAIQVFTEQPTHILVDYAGYFVGRPAAPRFSAAPNPPPGGAPLSWTIRFNKGISASGNSTMPPTVDGDPIKTTNNGYVWHWQGTGFVGDAAHVAVFAHRTQSGGPFKYIDQLGPGDTWTVDTSDGRRYTYLFAARKLTPAGTTAILNATREVPGNTFSMIACTLGVGPNPWGPTSLKYRIVVTGVEVGWTAIW